MWEIMKIIDEREMQKKAKKQNKANKDRKEQREYRSYSERVRAKWFSCAFNFGFFQLIYKDSLIFKSNLELAWSVILKQRELYESKHVAMECKCLKMWDLLYFLISSSMQVLRKMKKSFTNIARTTASTSKFIY